MNIRRTEKSQQTAVGALSAFLAFLIWGLSPIYWKALGRVDAFEIILHRVVWSFVFLMPLVLIGRQWEEFKGAVKNGKILAILLVTSILVGANWLIYIWAVNHDLVLQAVYQEQPVLEAVDEGFAVEDFHDEVGAPLLGRAAREAAHGPRYRHGLRFFCFRRCCFMSFPMCQ